MNINRDLKLSFYCNKLSISRYFFSLAFYFSCGGGGGGGEERKRNNGRGGLNSLLVAFTYIDS